MPFYLYEAARQDNGSLVYRQQRTVPLAGGGLIYMTCARYLADANDDVLWTITADEMLLAGGWRPDDHALVIDATPSRSSVSLFEIRSISGCSAADWTPVMLTLEHLFSGDEPPSTVQAMKYEFNDSACPRWVVREFLYLRGGYAAGDWNWGGNSRTTAALLWPGAWRYFQQRADQ